MCTLILTIDTTDSNADNDDIDYFPHITLGLFNKYYFIKLKNKFTINLFGLKKEVVLKFLTIERYEDIWPTAKRYGIVLGKGAILIYYGEQHCRPSICKMVSYVWPWADFIYKESKVLNPHTRQFFPEEYQPEERFYKPHPATLSTLTVYDENDGRYYTGTWHIKEVRYEFGSKCLSWLNRFIVAKRHLWLDISFEDGGWDISVSILKKEDARVTLDKTLERNKLKLIKLECANNSELNLDK